MPKQEYLCNTDGPFDVTLTFHDDVPASAPCPVCGSEGRHVLRAPAAHFARTWNEQANEARRDPYTQAKTQAWNCYNEQRDQGIIMDRPTEAGIQVGAQGIYEQERRPPVSEERKVSQRVAAAKKRDKQKKQDS